MNFFQKLFSNPQPIAPIVEAPQAPEIVESEEDKELKEIRNQEAREKRKLMRERLQLDLERKRLENEVEIERLRWEKDQIAQQRLDYRREQLEEFTDEDSEESSSLDKMLLTILSATMANQNKQTPQPPAYGEPVAPTNTETDKFETQFKAYWNNLNPSVQAIAKGLSDIDLKNQIKGSAPELTEEQLNKAVQLVRVS